MLGGHLSFVSLTTFVARKICISSQAASLGKEGSVNAHGSLLYKSSTGPWFLDLPFTTDNTLK